MNRRGLMVLAAFIAGVPILDVLRGMYKERRTTEAFSAMTAESRHRDDGTKRSPLPDVRFVDETGRARSLGQFAGRVILLNVWATWCLPCRKEMPSLDRLQQTLGSADFEVVALSVDTGGVPVVRRFYDELGLRALRIYVDATTDATGELGIVGIPTTLLVDPVRREVWRMSGPVAWDKPEVIESMRREIERVRTKATVG